MIKNFSVQDIADHYTDRHRRRRGIYDEKPYANYGYWAQANEINGACDALTDLVATAMGLSAEHNLLECGCGYGASAAYLATKYRPREIIGVDATPVRVEGARRMAAELGVEGVVKVGVGDATLLPFGDEQFDRVMAIECAFHFNTREAFFGEAFRVLKPGGILAMTDIVPALDMDCRRHSLDELREFLGADFKYICDANIYDSRTYRRLLDDVGFRNLNVRSIKADVVPGFADHLEKVAHESPPEAREKRMAVVNHFRTSYMTGADYVLVRACKPSKGA